MFHVWVSDKRHYLAASECLYNQSRSETVASDPLCRGSDLLWIPYRWDSTLTCRSPFVNYVICFFRVWFAPRSSNVIVVVCLSDLISFEIGSFAQLFSLSGTDFDITCTFGSAYDTVFARIYVIIYNRRWWNREATIGIFHFVWSVIARRLFFSFCISLSQTYKESKFFFYWFHFV